MSDTQSAATVQTTENDNPAQLGSNLETKPDKPAKPARAAKKAVGMPEAVWIILEENDDIPPTGLFLGHNGDSYLIRTGEPLLVPLKVIGILDDAIKTVPITDPGTMRVIGYRDRMRYPYRRVAAPADTE